eukprot:scaffold5329_cov112-Isochrysis_galbana.AAC.5
MHIIVSLSHTRTQPCTSNKIVLQDTARQAAAIHSLKLRIDSERASPRSPDREWPTTTNQRRICVLPFSIAPARKIQIVQSRTAARRPPSRRRRTLRSPPWARGAQPPVLAEDLLDPGVELLPRHAERRGRRRRRSSLVGPAPVGRARRGRGRKGRSRKGRSRNSRGGRRGWGGGAPSERWGDASGDKRCVGG